MRLDKEPRNKKQVKRLSNLIVNEQINWIFILDSDSVLPVRNVEVFSM